MKLFIGFWGAVLLGFQSAAADETKDQLIATIEASGRNESDDARHSVVVDDCGMTTYYWKNVKDHGWVLWTSFTFSMTDVTFKEVKNGKYGQFVFGAGVGDANDIAVVNFKATKERPIRHEKSVLRPANNRETTPSSRGDGKTHYFVNQTSVVVIHSGADVLEKAQVFTESFQEYVFEYCALTG